MADDDDQGTSSGSRPKLLLPKAPGPAQPLSHAASRHRKKLDAALSAGGYYDVAHGRESARAQRIQVIDLSRHPGLSALQVAAFPPDRQYKYQIERAELELTVNKAMQKKFDLIMAERTVVWRRREHRAQSEGGRQSQMPNRDSLIPARKRSVRSMGAAILLSTCRPCAGRVRRGRSDRSGEGQMGRSAMWRAG